MGKANLAFTHINKHYLSMTTGVCVRLDMSGAPNRKLVTDVCRGFDLEPECSIFGLAGGAHRKLTSNPSARFLDLRGAPTAS